ncbi:DUF6499 domain-containing protein [Mesorhizobium sp. M1409]|uniref:transcriptional regulator domain-containing protein n=1 Tax=unclassified Mesorhizobium TaxID=325217 RepID=UPI00333668D4
MILAALGHEPGRRQHRGLAGSWDKSSYDYTAHLTRQDRAWEFLRRNRAFRHDLARCTGADRMAGRSDFARHHRVARRPGAFCFADSLRRDVAVFLVSMPGCECYSIRASPYRRDLARRAVETSAVGL